MKIWEHKIVSNYASAQVNGIALYEGALDSLGDQGWELTSVTVLPAQEDPK